MKKHVIVASSVLWGGLVVVRFCPQIGWRSSVPFWFPLQCPVFVGSICLKSGLCCSGEQCSLVSELRWGGACVCGVQMFGCMLVLHVVCRHRGGCLCKGADIQGCKYCVFGNL